MLKVAQGNDISLCKRLMTWDGTQYVEVQAAEVTNLKVKYGTGTIDSATELTYTAVGSVVSFRLESTQIAQIGRYNIWITGSLAGNDSSINMENAVIVVPFSNASNAQDYVISETQDLGDDIFIPVPLTSAQVEALKVQLQTAIQAANTAKTQYEAALAQVQDIATETQATANKQAILDAIDDIEIDIPEGIALETNATANKNELTNKIGTASDTSSASTLFGKIAALDAKLQEATDAEVDAVINALS